MFKLIEDSQNVSAKFVKQTDVGHQEMVRVQMLKPQLVAGLAMLFGCVPDSLRFIVLLRKKLLGTTKIILLREVRAEVLKEFFIIVGSSDS